MLQADFAFASGDAIVITGAGSGIGRATALHAPDLSLMMSARDADPGGLEQTVALIAAAAGGDVRSRVADVAEEPAILAGMTATASVDGARTVAQ